MMTSVQPSPQTEQKRRGDTSNKSSAPSAVRLVLNGRVFDVTEEVCEKIPLLKESLLRRKLATVTSQRGDLHHPQQSDQGQYGGAATIIRRDSLLQCCSVLDSPTGAEADETSGFSHTAIKSQQSKRGVKRDSSSQRPSPTVVVRACPSDVDLNGRVNQPEKEPGVVLYFHRNPSVLETVLDFVHNGQLHLPGHVCPQLFARDLTFWGLSITDLHPCCYSKVASFLNEQKMVSKFRQDCAADPEESCGIRSGTAVSSWRRASNVAWRVMTEPASSVVAKVYFVIVCLVILTSFFIIAASTTEEFTRNLTRSEWREFLGDDEFEEYLPYIPSFFDEDVVDRSPTTSAGTTPQPPRKHYTPAALVAWLQYLSYACTAFLTLDYLFRVLFCPSLRRFVTDFFNISDAISLAAAYAKYAIDEADPEEKYDESRSDVINCLQLFRILRFLGPVSKVRGFRIIYYTLRSSVTELLLVFTLLGFLVMVFSALLYYLGDRASMPSIPVAMWYALVTMTTVGYGDVVPLSFRTKLIGSACVVMGVLVLAMTLPIVVNNFFALYSGCSNAPPSPKKRKEAETGKDEHTM